MDRLVEAFAVLPLLVAGCGSAEQGQDDSFSQAIAPQTNWKRDIMSTDLVFDLEAQTATAIVQVDASSRRGASFEVGDLEILSVQDQDGALEFTVADGQLDVGIKAREPHELIIDYRYQLHTKLEGALDSGATFLWPYFCGNLYPCKSDPSDGLKMGLELRGVPEDTVAIYPSQIPADAPSYMVAWAMGDYTQIELGLSQSGRKVSVFYLPGERQLAEQGTKHLLPIFDWLENTYGAYMFGDEVASVSANWGPGAFGGMEHHPFWHVSHDSMGDEETHAHEAAHGWFGDGVRLSCWEDLTLSEGTVSYITARAMEAVSGPDAGDKVWADYEGRLDRVIASDDRIAWPQSCGEIDVYHDLWNEVVYMKGAFFYRAVEQLVGREAIDKVLRRFYAEHGGAAAGVQDMLDTIEDETGLDPSELAQGWLMSLGRPDIE